MKDLLGCSRDVDGEFDPLGVQIIELGLAVWRLREAGLQPCGCKSVVHYIQRQLVYLPRLTLGELSRIVHIDCMEISIA